MTRNARRQRPRSPEAADAPSFSDVMIDARDACQAGTSENSTPVTKAETIAAVITRPLSAMPAACEMPSGSVENVCLARSTPHTAISRASAVPASDNSSPSATTVAAICQRDAPSDARTASSRVRLTDRESIRLAALTQPRSTRSPEAPSASSIQRLTRSRSASSGPDTTRRPLGRGGQRTQFIGDHRPRPIGPYARERC